MEYYCESNLVYINVSSAQLTSHCTPSPHICNIMSAARILCLLHSIVQKALCRVPYSLGAIQSGWILQPCESMISE